MDRLFKFIACYLLLTHCEGQNTFRNPILDEVVIDPSIIKNGGFYYMIHTQWNGIEILKSSILSNFRNAERRQIYRTPPEMVNLFAPEIHSVNGDLYIYFTMGVGFASRRMYVITCLDPSNPLGDWSNETVILPEDDIIPSPGTILQHKNGELYFIWSGQLSSEYLANLYIARMESAMKVLPPTVLLRTPTMEWERHGSPTNRGPFIIQKDERTFLVFSASASSSPDNCLGIMGLDGGRDPMVTSNWWNDVNHCVFGRNDTESVWGAGDAAFVKSPDDSETWMVYQAWDEINDGGQNRRTRIQKMEWEMNAPKFPAAVGSDRDLGVPSGE